MEEGDLETPTPDIEQISTDLHRMSTLVEEWANGLVLEKISADLNRIANVLDAGRTWFKDIGMLLTGLTRYAVFGCVVVFAVSGGKAIVEWQHVSVGTHCVVARDGVYGVVELKIKTELEQALKTKDEIGVQDLISKGKAFPLPKQTQCLVLDSTMASDSDSFFPKDLFDFSFQRRIRLLSGDDYGKAVWIPNSALQVATGANAVGGPPLDEMLEAFIAAKHHFSSLNSDYKESLMGAYNPESVTKLREGQYRVLLKYDSKPIQCEVDQSVASCSQ